MFRPKKRILAVLFILAALSVLILLIRLDLWEGSVFNPLERVNKADIHADDPSGPLPDLEDADKGYSGSGHKLRSFPAESLSADTSHSVRRKIIFPPTYVDSQADELRIIPGPILTEISRPEPDSPVPDEAEKDYQAKAEPFQKAAEDKEDLQAAPALPGRLLQQQAPDEFVSGGTIRLYSLLAQGIIRSYILTKSDHGEHGREREAGYIQVVAHIRHDLADRETDRFMEQGWPAEVFSFERDGRLYYRVLIGPFSSSEEARRISAYAGLCAEGLRYLQELFTAGRITSAEAPDKSYLIKVRVRDHLSETVSFLEGYGWPVMKTENSILYIGPFNTENEAASYRRQALNQRGWGPMVKAR